MTVTPVNDNHPTVIIQNSALDYYWRVNYDGLSSLTINDLKYSFLYYTSFSIWFMELGSLGVR